MSEPLESTGMSPSPNQAQRRDYDPIELAIDDAETRRQAYSAAQKAVRLGLQTIMRLQGVPIDHPVHLAIAPGVDVILTPPTPAAMSIYHPDDLRSWYDLLTTSLVTNGIIDARRGPQTSRKAGK